MDNKEKEAENRSNEEIEAEALEILRVMENYPFVPVWAMLGYLYGTLTETDLHVLNLKHMNS